MVKCKVCEHDSKNLTKLILLFDITNPSNVRISCENKYDSLSMSKVNENRVALHKALDICLDKISAELFKDGCASKPDMTDWDDAPKLERQYKSLDRKRIKKKGEVND